MTYINDTHKGAMTVVRTFEQLSVNYSSFNAPNQFYSGRGSHWSHYHDLLFSVMFQCHPLVYKVTQYMLITISTFTTGLKLVLWY